MGIPHFSALSDRRKKIALDHIEDFQVQEKLDGSYLKIKNDEAFPWAVRKGGKNAPIYTCPDEWGTDFWTRGFRASHAAFIEALPRINYPHWNYPDAFYPPGVMLEMEMLFSDTPNTIDYGPINRLIIHTPVALAAYHFSTSIELDDVPYTDDGYTIKRTRKRYEYDITNLDFLDGMIPHLKGEMNMGYITTVDDLEHEILHMVQTNCSNFSPGHFMRMEGMIFKHKDGWMFKVVDRNWFTEQNKKNYAFRNGLFRSPKGIKNSLMDRFYAAAANGDPKVAAWNSLKELDVEFKLYHDWDRHNYQPNTHLRNLESLASLRAQLNDIAKNGMPDESK
jgi:hypothetical protein